MAGLITLKMVTTGPNKNHKKGQIIQVDAVRAALLVADKHAEEVRDGDTICPQERQGL